jgi:hypothetical protein
VIQTCPNGHRLYFVTTDHGAGTGDYCPACGVSLRVPPYRPHIAWPVTLTVVLFAAGMAGYWFWMMFLR